VVARVVPASKGSLRITFSRKGENDDQRVADNPQCAVSLAMRILAMLEELRPGDTLVVAENRPISVFGGQPPVRIADD
jgi:hypothetical protein